MEIGSAKAKDTFSSVLETSQTEHVIIKHYNKPHSVLISWDEYKRLTGSGGCSYVGLATEAMNELSSTVLKWELKGEIKGRFSVRFTKQVEEYLKGFDITGEQWKRLIDTICDCRNLNTISHNGLYKRELNGLHAIYTLNGFDILLAYLNMSNNTPTVKSRKAKNVK